MNDERPELLEKANKLGLEFPSNIKTVKLKRMIEKAENPDSQENDNVQDNPENTATAPENTQEAVTTPPVLKETPVQEETPKKPKSLRQKIKEAKERATKLRVVTITNKDNRENDVMTTVHLSFENQYFGLSRNVPLDIPVEIEQALIDIAESTTMTLHKDEIINGRRTGNKIPVRVKKFAVSYGKQVQ